MSHTLAATIKSKDILYMPFSCSSRKFFKFKVLFCQRYYTNSEESKLKWTSKYKNRKQEDTITSDIGYWDTSSTPSFHILKFHKTKIWSLLHYQIIITNEHKHYDPGHVCDRISRPVLNALVWPVCAVWLVTAVS